MERLFHTIDVVKIIVWKKNKVLMGEKAFGPDKGKLVLPGGKLKSNEFYYYAAARELFEETNLIPARLAHVHSGKYFKTNMSVNFDVFFVNYSSCIQIKCKNIKKEKFSKIEYYYEKNTELINLAFYELDSIPLGKTTDAFQFLHEYIFDNNCTYFNVYHGSKNVEIKTSPLIIHNVLHKKRY